MEIQENITVKSRWEKLDRNRQSILTRARQCAELTIPSILPPEGVGEDAVLKTPYQGLGSRGVNNLASKLLMTLLPPNNSFFRLMINSEVQWEVEEQGVKHEVDAQLAKMEQIVLKEVEAKALRVPVFEALKKLLVTGNALLYQPEDGGTEIYRLDEYVVKRNPMGKVLEIITRDSIDFYSLPEDVRSEIMTNTHVHSEDDAEFKAKMRDKDFELFTHITLNHDTDKWDVKQECEGVVPEDSIGHFKDNDLPWIPLRWTANSGEDYGRGLVEEYLGDFLTLESLTKALVEGTTLASRIIGMVNPNGVTRARKLSKAKNGDFIEGRPDDVGFLQLDKHMDYSLCYQQIDKTEQRLKHAFMLMDAIQRNAERVTAEEIRTMARELESSLGGAYSLLSQEFQLPLIDRLLKQLQKADKLPELSSDVVEPVIITGLEALGRGHDLDKLMYFLQTLEPLGPEVVAQYVVPSEFMQRTATALGLDTDNLVRSEEEIQAMHEEAQEEQLMHEVAPQVMEQQQQQQQGGGM